jgi:DNA polymerase-3 subunit delta'
MTFDDFVGNQRLVGVLRRMLESGRIPHALLFTGQVGVGKFTLATLFVRALNCVQGRGLLCQECSTCRALAALENLEERRQAAVEARGSANPEAVPLVLRPHPSVSVLVPDGAFIRVAQMRYLVREAYRMPAAGARHNVFLIDEAEKLRFDYADVLLKVLEEPPEKTTLILVTAAPFDLRPTIRSRCVPLYFAPLSQEEIERYLKQHRPEWNKAERTLAAAATAGSLGTALRLDLEGYEQVRSQALQLLRAAALDRLDPEPTFAASAALAGKAGRTGGPEEGREAYAFSLDMLYSLLSDIIQSKAGTSDLSFRHPDLGGEVEALARQVSWPWLQRAVDSLDQIEGWQRRNVNRQLALDAWALTSRRSS